MRNGKGVTILVLANEGKESAMRISLGASGVSNQDEAVTNEENSSDPI
jgi:hypothetical protein